MAEAEALLKNSNATVEELRNMLQCLRAFVNDPRVDAAKLDKTLKKLNAKATTMNL